MVSYYQKFRLLTWKYFSYRKFYWYWTLLELALPVILIYILVKVAEGVIDVSEIRQPPTKTTPSNLSKIASYENFDTIYYMPRNNIWLAIMSRLSALLEEHGKKPAIESVDSEAELVLRLSQDQRKVIGIVFLSTDISSHVFKYKIRHKSVWNTSDLYAGDEIQQSGPYDPDPYLTSGFVAVQYYTDFAYLSYRKENNGVDAKDNTTVNNITVNFQPFPYPEYTKATTSRNMIPLVIAFTIIVVSLIMLCPLIFVITIERSRGITEILTLFGLYDSLIWFSWLIHTFLTGCVVITVITLILVTDLRGPYFANIRYTETTVVWLLTLLFFFSQTIFCFTFCTIFKNALLATFSFCTVSLSLAYLAEKSYDFHNMVLVHLSCLFPAAAFIQAFRRITYYELLEIPLNWSLVFENERSAADASLAFVFVMLMIDSALYSILAFYIDSINHGEKSPFFFLEYKRSGAYKDITKNTKIKYADDEQSKLLFQDAPSSGEAILTFKNLHKRFGSIHAVNGINLNLYRNEILTLAGLEKSGKTTTLHLALGLIEPTEGTITYKQSLNLLKNIDELRSELGFCPQENRLLPYFTILDHLVFYGMLRGEEELVATKNAIRYLYLIGIPGNGYEYPSIITKEIERKTSIITALIGNTEIVLLDEPVSGLDLVAKQSIWNFLKKLKQTRTIFMTSTTMMDASLISDRIAVINNGILVCNGSSEFLSKAFKMCCP